MGTNYFARIIPTHERKRELKRLIDFDDFSNIKDEIDKTYGRFEIDYDGNPTGGVIHLGKRSAGWKFLWNPNIYIIRHGHLENSSDGKYGDYVKDPDTYYYVYNLDKKGIKHFIFREDVEIYDEYGEKKDKEKFFEMAINWTSWMGTEALDSRTYNELEKQRNPSWKHYTCTGEYINALKSLGYKMISEDNSDFYSDGLRFATNTDFC